MSLAEVIKETKDKLEEAVKSEGLVTEEVVPRETIEEKPPEEVAPKEEQKPDEKPQETKEEVKKTSSDYARERREAKSAQRDIELAEARAKIAALEASLKPVESKNDDPEPSKIDDPQAWTEWKLRKAEEKLAKTEERLNKVDNYTEEQRIANKREAIRNAAMNEIQTFEQEVRQSHPDYDNVRSYYANMLAASIKIVNPDISNAKLVEAVNERMIRRASELLNKGNENPVQAMYEEAKRLGYQPPSNDDGKEEVVRPDLNKVAANRARNAGTAAAQGKGERGEITKTVAAQMTNAEFAKLPLAERKRLLMNA